MNIRVLRRLLIRPGGIGDCILSLPALECLRAGYTEVWVASQNVPLIRFADRVRSIPSTGLDLLGLPDVSPPGSLIEALRGFDSIISWYGTRRPEFVDAVRNLGLPFQFLPALPPEGAGTHAADYYFAQARAVRTCQGEAIPRVPCPRGEGGFTVIHPFASSPAKSWPLERYAELQRLLGARWCAGPEEPLDGAVRFDDLYELACWLASARLYIGNDCGITHLAAAVGTPVVALFGPTDPAVWRPRGPRVRIVATPSPGQAMDHIRLDDVVQAVRSLW